MKVGQLWLSHFRGTRYNFASPDKIYYQYPLSAGGQRLVVDGDHSQLVSKLAEVKGASAGRVYVTDGLDVLINKKGIHQSRSGWFPYYVTTLDKGFTFTEFETEFKGLEPGDIWPGFNFHAGSHYSISSQRWNYTLFWRLRQRDAVQPLTSSHPELRKALIATDWRGGGFYVSEHGRVWKPTDKVRVKAKALERLKARPDHILRTVRLYFDYTEGMLPVYVGEFRDRFEVGNYEGPCEVADDGEF
jgi:hypothetical protein